MRKALLVCGLGLIVMAAANAEVKVTPHEEQQRVDVTIDGKPFTSYVWPSTLKKPVLFPLIAADGVTVTRGYPLAPRDNERVDHPHHAGMWFNYGNANGFDFWNNSDAIKPDQRGKMGTIRQEKIVSAKSGKDRGELVVDSVWVTDAGDEILKQRTNYVFSQAGDTRTIDMTVTLTAKDKVVFHDDKEGVLGIRVAHFLESPTEKGGTFADASGRPTAVAAPTAGATGVYLTSEGVKGDAVWSTRGKWCELVGTTSDGHTETVAILDHTKNVGYPTYWHARGYGLFAANPLGRSIFDPKQQKFDWTLEKGQNATFHYRVMLFSHAASAEEMNRAADAFEKE
jgi:hypothetical protein